MGGRDDGRGAAAAPRRRVPFRVTLITFTALLSLLIAGSILAVVYIEGQRAADRQAARTFELAASTVEERLTALVAGAVDVVEVGASQSLVSNGSAELSAGASAELIPLLDALLMTDPALYSVYFGGDVPTAGTRGVTTPTATPWMSPSSSTTTARSRTSGSRVGPSRMKSASRSTTT